MQDRDGAYLWDMLEAAREAIGFTAGIDFAKFETDRKTQMAVERAVEIVGEAARRVSDKFKTEHPEVPWKNIVAQRNVLAHEYGEIKQERMWLLTVKHIPDLIARLEVLVPDKPGP